LVTDERWAAFESKQEVVSRETRRLAGVRIAPGPAQPGRPELTRDFTLLELLRRPGVGFDDVSRWLPADADPVSRETLRLELGRVQADQVVASIETAVRYAGYIDKQQEQIERSAAAAGTPLPPTFDYGSVPALSIEVRQILSRHKPDTVGRAASLPGVTPAAISLLLVHLKRLRRQPTSANDDGAERVSA
jgi:tRNA uridine 5-carboxymethylaminomethyl modification enzyme